jgi:hypothetical protein
VDGPCVLCPSRLWAGSESCPTVALKALAASLTDDPTILPATVPPVALPLYLDDFFPIEGFLRGAESDLSR